LVGAAAAAHLHTYRYRCEMIYATAEDGVRVPISILYRPDVHVARADAGEGTGPFAAPPPLHLYGYGSYGYSCDPVFNASLLSLADRGVVCATAHIRGGGELGRLWCARVCAGPPPPPPPPPLMCDR
jgi:oligopeptidase B